LATGGIDGKVRICEVKSGKLVRNFGRCRSQRNWRPRGDGYVAHGTAARSTNSRAARKL